MVRFHHLGRIVSKMVARFLRDAVSNDRQRSSILDRLPERIVEPRTTLPFQNIRDTSCADLESVVGAQELC